MKKQIFGCVALAMLSFALLNPAHGDGPDKTGDKTVEKTQVADNDHDADDLNDVSDPARELKDPEWFDNSISAMHPPDRMTVNEQRDCTMKIVEYVNTTFHTEFGPDNVVPVRLPGWAKAESGFVRGGGYNIRLVGMQPAMDQHSVHHGRFMPAIGWIELGAHAALHLPGSIDGFQTFTRKLSDDSKNRQMDFVAHIDTANPWEPLGGFIHLFRDVIGAAGRNPCPGTE
jgi:hypothetical protein